MFKVLIDGFNLLRYKVKQVHVKGWQELYDNKNTYWSQFKAEFDYFVKTTLTSRMSENKDSTFPVVFLNKHLIACLACLVVPDTINSLHIGTSRFISSGNCSSTNEHIVQ